MTTPLWCLVIVAALPQLLALLGDYYRKSALGSIDNDDPRGQAARLEGSGARAYAAQQNAWEALPTFMVAVWVAHAAGADAPASAIASIGFVATWLLHAVFYVTGLSTLRSLSFLAGIGCCTWLVVLAAVA